MKTKEDVKAKYSHHVRMGNWIMRSRAYKRTLIEQLSEASWVDEEDTRTFGFSTRDRAEQFATDTGGELL
jgi:hypothetical protein